MGDTEIKIFMLNDYEWWAAETLQQAIDAYQKDYQLTDSDIEGDRPYFSELSDEAMDTLTFADDLEDKDSPTRSFREQLSILVESGNTFPCLFAATE